MENLLGILWKISWQTAALAGVVFIVTRLARRAPASWRYGLWLIVLVKFLVPPFAQVPGEWVKWQRSEQREVRVMSTVTREAAPNAVIYPPPDSVLPGVPAPATTSQPAHTPIRLLDLLPWLWVAGAVAMAGLLLVRAVKQAKVVGSASPAPCDVAEALEECAGQLSVRRVPGVRLSDAARTPMLVGLLRPTILLPPAILDSFSSEDLRAIILHELAHVKRLDMAALWLEQVVKVAFFFNPVLWLVGREIRRERELACDEMVLSKSSIRREDYASGYVAALKMANRNAIFSTSLAMAEPVQVERKRVESILRSPIRRLTLKWIIGLLLAGVVAVPTIAGIAPLKVPSEEYLRSLFGDRLDPETDKWADCDIAYKLKEPLVWSNDGVTLKIIGVGCDSYIHYSNSQEAKKPDSVVVLIAVHDEYGRDWQFDIVGDHYAVADDGRQLALHSARGPASVGMLKLTYCDLSSGDRILQQLSDRLVIRAEPKVTSHGPYDLQPDMKPQVYEGGKSALVVADFGVDNRDTTDTHIVSAGPVRWRKADRTDDLRAYILLYTGYEDSDSIIRHMTDIALYGADGRRINVWSWSHYITEYNRSTDTRFYEGCPLGLNEPFYGMQLVPLTPERAKQNGVSKGFVVAALHPTGPAQKAGIRVGDVVVSLAGHKFDQMRDDELFVGDMEPASADIIRDGKQLRVVIHPAYDMFKAGKDGVGKKAYRKLTKYMRDGWELECTPLHSSDPVPADFQPVAWEFKTFEEGEVLESIEFSFKDIPIPPQLWDAVSNTQAKTKT